METYVKALQLIIFVVEDDTHKTLLSDTLYYNPGYRTGDVIHLIQPLQRTGDPESDRQYVVLNAKHIVRIDDTKPEPNNYVLLVEVAELAEAEWADLDASIYAAMN